MLLQWGSRSVTRQAGIVSFGLSDLFAQLANYICCCTIWARRLSEASLTDFELMSFHALVDFSFCSFLALVLVFSIAVFRLSVPFLCTLLLASGFLPLPTPLTPKGSLVDRPQVEKVLFIHPG